MKRRELASWTGLATFGVAALAICAAVTWSVLPRERRLSLGPESSFRIGQPEFRALDTQVYVFVVNLEGEIIAWDSNSPVQGQQCRYKWVPTNHRFEDPCSGSKWCVDGTAADNRYGPVRTLDRYRLEVDSAGNVWLYPDQKIAGTPVVEPVNTGCPSP